MIDSFGVRLPDFDHFINHTHDYKNFYDNPPSGYWDRHIGQQLYIIFILIRTIWGIELVEQLIKPEKEWLLNYTIVNHRSLTGENGFILNNGRFERFEPIGITWDDSYCRRITDAGPSGCFVERDLSAIPDFNYQGNNCSGWDSIDCSINSANKKVLT